MRIRPMKIRRIPKPETFLLFLILVSIPICSYGQFDQLISETQEFKNNSVTLSKDIVSIIKIIAFVSLGISGLTFLFIKDQQSDVSTKLGKIIIGIAIFLALIAVGEQIASL